MNPDKVKQFRDTLVELHERVGGEVNYVVESIHDDVNIKENISSAPVHLADVATEAVDADVQVLHTERSILDDIDAGAPKYRRVLLIGAKCREALGDVVHGAREHGDMRRRELVRYKPCLGATRDDQPNAVVARELERSLDVARAIGCDDEREPPLNDRKHCLEIEAAGHERSRR